MIENPTETVTFKASRELIEQLKDWSERVQVRITEYPEGYELEFRTSDALPPPKRCEICGAVHTQ